MENLQAKTSAREREREVKVCIKKLYQGIMMLTKKNPRQPLFFPRLFFSYEIHWLFLFVYLFHNVCRKIPKLLMFNAELAMAKLYS